MFSTTDPHLQGTYLIYHKHEPESPLVHIILLFLAPGLLAYSLIIHQFTHPVLGLLTTYATYWTIILSLQIIYRLSPLHPLAKFPGPVAAKISKLWMVFLIARKDVHLTVRKLHAKYGKVVRIGNSSWLVYTTIIHS